MDIAKIFENGRSQAVRLPKEYRFDNEEVFVKRIGEMVVLIPKDKIWDIFLEGLDEFSEDFLDFKRDDDIPQKREEI